MSSDKQHSNRHGGVTPLYYEKAVELLFGQGRDGWVYSVQTEQEGSRSIRVPHYRRSIHPIHVHGPLNSGLLDMLEKIAEALPGNRKRFDSSEDGFILDMPAETYETLLMPSMGDSTIGTLRDVLPQLLGGIPGTAVQQVTCERRLGAPVLKAMLVGEGIRSWRQEDGAHYYKDILLDANGAPDESTLHQLRMLLEEAGIHAAEILPSPVRKNHTRIRLIDEQFHTFTDYLAKGGASDIAHVTPFRR